MRHNRRYKITKGNRYFLVREFDPADLGEQIYSILVETYKTYEGIKASADREEILRSVKSWHTEYYKVYGAFFRENGELAGYTLLSKNDNCISIPVHKTKPQYEKYQASAALLKNASGSRRLPRVRRRFDGITIIHNINGVLLMEEISRSSQHVL